MISDALIFLREHLNAQLTAASGADGGEPAVVFVEGEKMDPIGFKLGAVSLLLINVEEDNTLRRGDPYNATRADGTSAKVQPEIRLNLYVLFVARFKAYEDGLRYLSRIIRCFQSERVLSHHNAPALSDQIDRLVMELVTLPFSEQNEVWSALRTTYQPSVLYRVRMVVFSDEDAAVQPDIGERIVRVST